MISPVKLLIVLAFFTQTALPLESQELSADAKLRNYLEQVVPIENQVQNVLTEPFVI